MPTGPRNFCAIAPVTVRAPSFAPQDQLSTMNECLSERIAASIVTLLMSGYCVELTFEHGLVERLTRCATRT